MEQCTGCDKRIWPWQKDKDVKGPRQWHRKCLLDVGKRTINEYREAHGLPPVRASSEEITEWAFHNVDISQRAAITLSLPVDHWIFSYQQEVPSWAIDAGTD